MTTQIFASLHNFFEGGAINGRKEANTGFMRELLTQDPFDQYHFFVANPADLEKLWGDLGALPALKRGGVHAFHRMALPQALASTPYYAAHFSDPVSDFVEFTAARNRWSQHLFPITAVNHTISYSTFAPSFLAHCWPGCGPREAIGCNSSAAKDVMRAWFDHLGAPTGCFGPRLEVIPMGASPRCHKNDASARKTMRERLHLTDKSVLLLLFGRIALDDKLDPHPLCMALRRVRAEHPGLDMPLLISGFTHEGDNAPEFLEALGRVLGVDVRVLPNPTPEEKDQLFAAADIFLSPSDNIQETFGLTLVEAAMAGLPVIASDWDGYRDIVEHNVTGLRIATLAPAHTPDLDMLSHVLYENQSHFLRAQQTAINVPALAEGISFLATDTAARQRMGQHACERALRLFSWGAVVRRWLNFWEELRAVPLSPAEEQFLRTAKHPLHPPLGKIFAPYATATLGADGQEGTLLASTAAGQQWLRGRLPWAALGKAPSFISKEALRPLLVLTRKAQPLHALEERLQAQGQDKENVHALILWALKHDLLESPTGM